VRQALPLLDLTDADRAQGRADLDRYRNLYSFLRHDYAHRHLCPAALFEVLRGANERQEIHHILHRHGDAVLMSADEYKSLVETHALLSPHSPREALPQTDES